MMCLHCGHCCETMSPLAPEGDPCPHIVRRGSFVLCGVYDRRPDQCRNHGYPARICPIGLDVLGERGIGIRNSEDYRMRVDHGLKLCKALAVENAGNGAGRSRALDVAVSARPAPLHPSDR